LDQAADIANTAPVAYQGRFTGVKELSVSPKTKVGACQALPWAGMGAHECFTVRHANRALGGRNLVCG
jgi:hypothetical protein